jgi:hypothetical protein
MIVQLEWLPGLPALMTQVHFCFPGLSSNTLTQLSQANVDISRSQSVGWNSIGRLNFDCPVLLKSKTDTVFVANWDTCIPVTRATPSRGAAWTN